MSEEKGGITVAELQNMLPQVSVIITAKHLQKLGVCFYNESGFERGKICEVTLGSDFYEQRKVYKKLMTYYGNMQTLYIKEKRGAYRSTFHIHQLIPCLTCDKFIKPDEETTYGRLLLCSKKCLDEKRLCGDDLCYKLGCRPCVNLDCSLVLDHCKGCSNIMCNEPVKCTHANTAHECCSCKNCKRVSKECIDMLCPKRSWGSKHCMTCGGLM